MKKKSDGTLGTWDDILVRAVQCGLTIEKFWQITWRDFSIYRRAYQLNEWNDMAKYRLVAHTVYMMNTGDKKRLPIEKFYPLPIDVKKEERPLNDDELKALRERFVK